MWTWWLLLFQAMWMWQTWYWRLGSRQTWPIPSIAQPLKWPPLWGSTSASEPSTTSSPSRSWRSLLCPEVWGEGGGDPKEREGRPWGWPPRRERGGGGGGSRGERGGGGALEVKNVPEVWWERERGVGVTLKGRYGWGKVKGGGGGGGGRKGCTCRKEH